MHCKLYSRLITVYKHRATHRIYFWQIMLLLISIFFLNTEAKLSAGRIKKCIKLLLLLFLKIYMFCCNLITGFPALHLLCLKSVPVTRSPAARARLRVNKKRERLYRSTCRSACRTWWASARGRPRCAACTFRPTAACPCARCRRPRVRSARRTRPRHRRSGTDSSASTRSPPPCCTRAETAHGHRARTRKERTSTAAPSSAAPSSSSPCSLQTRTQRSARE